MDPAIARELAQAYMRTRPRAGWPEEVTRAAVDLLPDTDAWAVLEDEQGWAVRVVDAGAIYRLSVLDARAAQNRDCAPPAAGRLPRLGHRR